MGCGSSVLVRHLFPKRFEYSLQVASASNDHACLNDAQLEEETEVVQISIKERVLVVPFNFQTYPLLETIDLVSRRFSLLFVDAYLGSELLFFSVQPLPSRKLSIRLAITLFRPPPFKTSLRRNSNARSTSITSCHSVGCAVDRTPAAFRHS